MNLHTSPLSSLDNRYTFLFVSTNPFFISIMWSHNFFISILSLPFFPKIWIHLWNLWETNFLAVSSDLAISFSSSYISHSSAIFFTSIILSFFGFFFFFFSFSSHFFIFFSLFSFFFYFCYPDFLCFSIYYLPYFFRHLVVMPENTFL